MAVLTSTHNLCFEQKYENYQNFSSESFQFLVVKFAIYLNRRVFVMLCCYPAADHITKTCLFKYIDNFTTKKPESFHIKNSDIFHISAQNIDCGYSLEPPQQI